MKRPLITFCLSLAALSCASISAAQDAPAAPMINMPGTAPSPNTALAAAQKTKSAFRQNYIIAGKPKLAIFWNRKLDDQLSQWYTRSRKIDTREGWWDGGKGFTATQNRLDVEGRFDDRPQPNELIGFQFGSGFTRTLINTGAEIVDRDTIMRLTHSNAKEAAANIIVADYQQIEIDALIGYADYIVEVLYAPSRTPNGPLTFMISIKEVKTGKLISMFPSENAIAEGEYTYEWVATDAGYVQQKVPVVYDRAPYDDDNILPGTPEHIGWTVAMQTMQAMTKYWRS